MKYIYLVLLYPLFLFAYWFVSTALYLKEIFSDIGNSFEHAYIQVFGGGKKDDGEQ